MIDLAIIGFGGWGRRHAISAADSGRFRLRRAVTKDPDDAREFAASHDIRLATEIEEVLSDPEIDAVTVATPNSFHADQIVRSAAAGKHVYCEKPITLTKADAERAVAACADAGVVLAVGHNQRSYEAIIELKRIVREGLIGTPIHIEGNISHDFLMERIAAGTQALHELAAEKTKGQNTHEADRHWRSAAAEAPGGGLVHMGVHRIDAFIHLVGDITWVFAQSQNHVLKSEFGDMGSVLLRFASGATGYLASSLVTPLYSRLSLFGTEGWAEAVGPRKFEDYAFASLKSVTHCRRGEVPVTRECELVDSVKLHFGAFADAIEGRAPFPVRPDQMINNAATLEAIANSLERSEPVDVD